MMMSCLPLNYLRRRVVFRCLMLKAMIKISRLFRLVKQLAFGRIQKIWSKNSAQTHRKPNINRQSSTRNRKNAMRSKLKRIRKTKRKTRKLLRMLTSIGNHKTRVLSREASTTRSKRWKINMLIKTRMNVKCAYTYLEVNSLLKDSILMLTLNSCKVLCIKVSNKIMMMMIIIIKKLLSKKSQLIKNY